MCTQGRRDPCRFLRLFTVSPYFPPGGDASGSNLAFLPDADIVCTRAKTHYDPENFNLMRDEDGSPPTNPTDALEAFKQQFKKLNPRQETMMYFSVRSSRFLFRWLVANQCCIIR